ncbi:MAG: hypothetical protein L0228_08440 [Planctomycetes bacterium]|nr:hypothetical protein [Planctomycetota bacterium]
MEARVFRFVSRAAVYIFLGLAVNQPSTADASAGYKTRNFTVSAPSPELAKEIGDAAEAWRRQLSIEWLGQEMPPWSKPCPINVKLASGAGGATSFVFDRGHVFGWKMNIQGSRERLLDSVLPHEVTHTIFASHFRQPLPRWADEGACTTVEHRSEIAKQERNLIQFLKTGRGIPFKQMFAMKEYPSDVMPLYAQGHSTAQWLIENRGREAFLAFLADGMRDENWERAVHQHYGFGDLLTMQNAWNDWVKQGRPRLTPETSPIGTLASNTRGASTPIANAMTSASNTVSQQATLRGQSPDDISPMPAQPAARSSAKSSPITVASASGSVYAAAAARAERERQNAARPSNVAATHGPSVYDASRATGAIRR